MTIKQCITALFLVFVGLQSANSAKLSLTDELACLTEAIYFEARNQPTVGQMAVAQVILNRVSSTKFPNTICKVVNQPRQFSYRYEIPVLRYDDISAYRKASQIAEISFFEGIIDVTDGATMYHATRITPHWNYSKLHHTVTINQHKFYVHH